MYKKEKKEKNKNLEFLEKIRNKMESGGGKNGKVKMEYHFISHHCSFVTLYWL